MLLDARTLPPRHRFEADVCVVGAGAAGIALARELGGQGTRVTLLESGGFELESPTQDLYDGRGTTAQGSDAAPYLKSSRLRFFGGTTNHWHGQCRPLDPIDFEARAWVPESGWPFGRGELEPYYGRAEPILGLRPYETPPAPGDRSRAPRLLPAASEVESTHFYFSPPTRFGREYRDELVRSPHVELVLHANVSRLETGPDDRRVERARVATLDGGRFEVRARRFVLAAGGIENPRLLLLSGGADGRGLGNRHDLVGRYFMEHPHLTTGRIVLLEARSLGGYLKMRGRRRLMLRLVEPLQRRTGVLNSVLQIDRRPDRAPLTIPVSRLAADVDDLRHAQPGSARPLGSDFRLSVMTEQVPDRDNRVTLSDDLDALGQPKVRLDWRLTERDLDSVRRTCELLGRALGAWGVGRLNYRDDAEVLTSHLYGGNHHMGTTRMHADPRRGVVDADCRVHGVENLYVAGSSVFPTGGCSNPTLTIVAMALRLADHLRARAAT